MRTLRQYETGGAIQSRSRIDGGANGRKKQSTDRKNKKTVTHKCHILTHTRVQCASEDVKNKRIHAMLSRRAQCLLTDKREDKMTKGWMIERETEIKIS